MKSRKVSFENGNGIVLAAVLELPEDEQPQAFAIFAHCFTCTKSNTAAVNICRALSRRQIAVLRFDFTGLGDSGGDFAATSFSHNVADILAAGRFLSDAYQAPAILIGHSLGGAAVLHAANQLESVRAVVTLGAPFEPRHALQLFESAQPEIEASGESQVVIAGRPFTIRKAFVDDLQNQKPGEIIGQLRAALLVMHSPRDEVVGIENAAAIYQAAKHPKSFISLEPADHLLSRKEDSGYAADMIATWARRYLEVRDEISPLLERIDNRVTVRTPTGGFRSDMFANGHALVADEPVAFGGTNQGPSPYDYLQAALGACTGMTVQMYARRKKWPLDEVVVRLHHAKIHAQDCVNCEDPGQKIDYFERELELSGDLTLDQRQRLLEIAEKCPVHKTLLGEVRIKTSLRIEDALEVK
ncbi:bifunctional alpha/beta hydrolase/OsmC family protein [Geopsychrobacter electrodiphilus]|uniref:bifunctional alpha/beta hydrolase/OsmC family protein n=1 Tax=Geopsychrobacter electrodiphilus TaxID=225196 RepID=UPI00036742C2|nr:bifunctional alpha/beta hydrolase/OsmC family protein [Geopsychrobacter electrodiphilus]